MLVFLRKPLKTVSVTLNLKCDALRDLVTFVQFKELIKKLILRVSDNVVSHFSSSVHLD